MCILTNPSIAQDSSVILLKELWASALIWYRNSINRASWRLYTPTKERTRSNMTRWGSRSGQEKRRQGRKQGKAVGKEVKSWGTSQGRRGGEWYLSGQLVSRRKLMHPSLEPIVNFHSHARDHLVIDWLTTGTLKINGSDTMVARRRKAEEAEDSWFINDSPESRNSMLLSAKVTLTLPVVALKLETVSVIGCFWPL